MIDIGNGVKLITRAEWGARPPRSTTALDVETNTDHWEGPHMGWPWVHDSCYSKVRGIQAFHMDSRGWTDIAYNTLSCGHGFVFEGRGRNRRSAANGTTAGNSSSYADCYLGGEGDAFTEDGKRAKRQAGLWLAGPGGPRRCHRDWKPTACPGDEICTWTHAGQPVAGAPTPGPTPEPPSHNFTEDNDMEILVRGASFPFYYIYVGGKIRQVEGYPEADQSIDTLLVTQTAINATRVAQGWAPTQIVTALPKKVKEDGKPHWEPYVWPQNVINDLLRANSLPVPQ